ncbi:MAG: hypothetical protein IT370_29240 [Deltaproteobacteria bacterium]|nr:hypothetical protein [Deltaproteobacteria bacterium]
MSARGGRGDGGRGRGADAGGAGGGGAGGGRFWLAAGAAVLVLGLVLLGWAVRERRHKQRAVAAEEHAHNEAARGGGRGDRIETSPVGGPLPEPTVAPAAPGGAAAPALVPGGGQLDPGSRPPAPAPATPGAVPVPPAGPAGAALAPGDEPGGPSDPAGAVSPNGPNTAPAPMAPAEDRASRVRLTLALRDQLAELGRLQGGGDDKLAGAIEETRARLAEMESWATQQAITAAEWAAARSELERLRKQPTEPPSRPR